MPLLVFGGLCRSARCVFSLLRSITTLTTCRRPGSITATWAPKDRRLGPGLERFRGMVELCFSKHWALIITLFALSWREIGVHFFVLVCIHVFLLSFNLVIMNCVYRLYGFICFSIQSKFQSICLRVLHHVFRFFRVLFLCACLNRSKLKGFRSGYPPPFVLYACACAYPSILEDFNAKGADENALDAALEAALGGLSGFDCRKMTQVTPWTDAF